MTQEDFYEQNKVIIYDHNGHGLIRVLSRPTWKREVASDPKGNETGNRIEELQGIIKQVECNRPTGVGAIQLETKQDRVIEVSWHKVNSPELCSKVVPSQWGLDGATKLTELAAGNILSKEATITKIKSVDGFVVEVDAVKKVDYPKYIKSVNRYEAIGDNREVLDWFFQNRRSN